jgi:hypothetical protein
MEQGTKDHRSGIKGKNIMVWKIIKKCFKIVAIFIAIIFLVLAGYVISNMPFASKYKDLSESELQLYLDYLNSSTSEPLEFVSEKFKQYDVVLIGETHYTLQSTIFLQKLIPYLYQHNGVRIIGWEFGSSSAQAEVDSLLTAPSFDRRKFIDIMRRAIYFWNLEEYLDVFHVVWEFNRQLPSGAEPIRFLQLGSEYVPRRLNSSDPEVRRKEAERFYWEKKFAEIIEREAIQKNEKALVWAGSHHTFTKYRQPRMFFQRRTGEKRRAGNFLYDKYPEKVYSIKLHFPAPHRWVVLTEILPSIGPDANKMFYPFKGIIDQVYARYQKPLAFDTRQSPFGKIKDNYSYYSFDYFGGVQLQDFCDGYIMLCSFAEIKPVHPIEDWITSEKELNEIKNILPPEEAKRIKDIPSFLKQLEQRITGYMQMYHQVN